MTSTFADSWPLFFFAADPPLDAAVPPMLSPVSCNTFEMWALATDNFTLSPTDGYSGVGDWNPTTTGTFAPPAPEGPTSELFSWEFTFPATASGNWTMDIDPTDKVGNMTATLDGVASVNFRNNLAVVPSELADCENFSDVSGNANEVYIRYLADLGLISGFADGTFGPDKTLTRAEAATLFEISYGNDETTLPTSAPVGCEFTDVSASDWFAGWVWQACDDGFMNGIGGGLFDPNNLLTRGQVVTIMNNIANLPLPMWTGHLVTPNVLVQMWGNPAPFPLRSSAWTDVSIGDYFAEGVVQAYGTGVADGTSDNAFSPNTPITRGLFAKWLYRAMSRTD
jgi:hypothetical protein